MLKKKFTFQIENLLIAKARMTASAFFKSAALKKYFMTSGLNSLGQLIVICLFDSLFRTDIFCLIRNWSAYTYEANAVKTSPLLESKTSNRMLITVKCVPFRIIPLPLYFGKNCANQLCLNTTKIVNLRALFDWKNLTHVAFCRLQLITHELGSLVTVTKVTEWLYSKWWDK